ARVFVPLLFVFLSYQAGYVMFAAIFCAARFLRLSFGGDHGEKPQAPAGGAGGSLVPGPVVRFLRNVRASAGPVLASTALASAVCPQAAAQVALRTVTAAAQQTGYGLGLLDPGLFVGFPLIAETGFGVRAQVSPVEWAVFLLGLAVLAACALRRGTSGFPDRDLSGMRALCVLFAGFMFAYLAGYRLMGDDYRVWKFVSSAALPVSFVPAVLLVSSVREAARGREGRTWAACALAAAALAVPQLAYRNPSGPRTSLMNASSLTPIIETVSAALHFDRGQELLIFDFSSMEHVFAAMIVSQYSGVGRVRFVSAPYFGEALDDYLVYAERGAPVYSDRAYPDLYRGSPVALPDEFTVFRYDPFMLRSGGAVSYYGLYRFTFMPGVRGVGVRILVPQRLRGRDLVVRISFSDGMDGLDPACARPVAREAGTPPGDAVGRVGGAFLLPVPGKSQTDGHIGLILNFPDYPVTDPTDGRAWASPVPRNCMFRFDSVELLPPEDGPGGAEGRGRASAVEDPSSAGHGSAGAQ
ncbi:MAG: hypothetical protein LBQ79_03575, partial [Deltaproteobacteria bacterium]|nr:hypothetical protein [Deltaproteobacteria bacterium]